MDCVEAFGERKMQLLVLSKGLLRAGHACLYNGGDDLLLDQSQTSSRAGVSSFSLR